MMRLRFLGTGTSTGVPQIGCTCPTCISTDTHDKRLRTSAILTIGNKNILIDCGPDFRQQIIDAGAPELTAAVLTHSHYDHVVEIFNTSAFCGDYQRVINVILKRSNKRATPEVFYRHSSEWIGTGKSAE